jgi:hypothetical protein
VQNVHILHCSRPPPWLTNRMCHWWQNAHIRKQAGHLQQLANPAQSMNPKPQPLQNPGAQGQLDSGLMLQRCSNAAVAQQRCKCSCHLATQSLPVTAAVSTVAADNSCCCCWTV